MSSFRGLFYISYYSYILCFLSDKHSHYCFSISLKSCR